MYGVRVKSEDSEVPTAPQPSATAGRGRDRDYPMTSNEISTASSARPANHSGPLHTDVSVKYLHNGHWTCEVNKFLSHSVYLLCGAGKYIRRCSRVVSDSNREDWEYYLPIVCCFYYEMVTGVQPYNNTVIIKEIFQYTGHIMRGEKYTNI